MRISDWSSDVCSSDLQGLLRAALPVFVGVDYASRVGAAFLSQYPKARLDIRLVDKAVHPIKDGFDVAFGVGPLQDRSEEHTSELQSLMRIYYAVFCL